MDTYRLLPHLRNVIALIENNDSFESLRQAIKEIKVDDKVVRAFQDILSKSKDQHVLEKELLDRIPSNIAESINSDEEFMNYFTNKVLNVSGTFGKISKALATPACIIEGLPDMLVTPNEIFLEDIMEAASSSQKYLVAQNALRKPQATYKRIATFPETDPKLAFYKKEGFVTGKKQPVDVKLEWFFKLRTVLAELSVLRVCLPHFEEYYAGKTKLENIVDYRDNTSVEDYITNYITEPVAFSLSFHKYLCANPTKKFIHTSINDVTILGNYLILKNCDVQPKIILRDNKNLQFLIQLYKFTKKISGTSLTLYKCQMGIQISLAEVKIAGLFTFNELQAFNIYTSNLTIIGPNDTGKSKFIESILWALNPTDNVPIHHISNTTTSNNSVHPPQLELHFDGLKLLKYSNIILKYSFEQINGVWKATPVLIFPLKEAVPNMPKQLIRSDQKFMKWFKKLKDSVKVLLQTRSNNNEFAINSSNLISNIRLANFMLFENFKSLHFALKANTKYSALLILPTNTFNIEYITRDFYIPRSLELKKKDIFKMENVIYKLDPNITKAKILFYKEGSSTPFELEDVSGMIQEIVHIFTLIYFSKADTIILDEPGNNFHPPFRSALLSFLLGIEARTIIIITHCVEMISATGLLNTYHCSRANGGTKAVRLIDPFQSGSNTFSMLEPTFRPLLFSTHVLLVEGFADNQIINALFHLKQNSSLEALRDLPTFWTPIRLEGAARIKGLLNIIKKLKLPVKFLGDSDIMQKGKNFRGSVVASVTLELSGEDKVKEIERLYGSDKPAAHEKCEKQGIFAWFDVDLENMIVDTPDACYTLFNGYQKFTECGFMNPVAWVKSQLHDCWKEIDFSDVVEAVKLLVEQKNPRFIKFLQFLKGQDMILPIS